MKIMEVEFNPTCTNECEDNKGNGCSYLIEHPMHMWSCRLFNVTYLKVHKITRRALTCKQCKKIATTDMTKRRVIQ